jgi:hypothetical protein
VRDSRVCQSETAVWQGGATRRLQVDFGVSARQGGDAMAASACGRQADQTKQVGWRVQRRGKECVAASTLEHRTMMHRRVALVESGQTL